MKRGILKRNPGIKARFFTALLAAILSVYLPITGYQDAQAMAAVPAVTALEYIIHALLSSTGFTIKSSADTRSLSHDFVQWVQAESKSNVPSDQEIIIAGLFACYKYQFDNAKSWLSKVQAGAVDLYHDAISLPKDVVDVFNAYIAEKTGRYTGSAVNTKVSATVSVPMSSLLFTADNPYHLTVSGQTLGSDNILSCAAYGTAPIIPIVTDFRLANDGKYYSRLYLVSLSNFTVVSLENGVEDTAYNQIKTNNNNTRTVYSSLANVIMLPVNSYYGHLCIFGGTKLDLSKNLWSQDVFDYIYGLLTADTVPLGTTVVLPAVQSSALSDTALTDREWTIIEGGQGSDPDPDTDPFLPYVPLVGIGGQLEMTEDGLQSWIDEQNKEINNEGIDEYINKIFPSPETNPDVFPSENPNPKPDPDPVPDPDPAPDPDPDLDVSESSDPKNWKVPLEFKNKFPFSIPWDVAACLTVLQADPVEPVFEIPFVVDDGKNLKIHETIVLDLSAKQWGEIITLIRYFVLLLYIAGLVFVTRNLIKG